MSGTRIRVIPLCEERRRLRSVYSQTVTRHSRAVEEVIQLRGKVAMEEYQRLRACADQARQARSTARLALDHHREEHGC